jgi:hypothetical protein
VSGQLNPLFLLHTHAAMPRNQVTRESPRQATPKYFRAELYPPQAALIYRMLTMEREQRSRIEQLPGEKYMQEYHGSDTEMVYDAAFLDAPFGFGKTLVVCALVACEIAPKPHALMVNVMTDVLYDHINRLIVYTDKRSITVKGARTTKDAGSPAIRGGLLATELDWFPDRAVRSTLVIVPTTILGQWEEMVRQYAPHLNVYVVNGAEGFREYRKIFEGGRAGEYHIVLVRAGTFSVDEDIWSRSPKFDHMAPGRRSVPTVTAMAMLTHNAVWQRVVVDDFDTMKLPTDAHMPAAHFTWYVSATSRRTLRCIINTKTGNIREVSKGLVPGTWPIMGVSLDEVMRRRLTVTCEMDFATETCSLPVPVFRRVMVDPPTVIRMFRGLELDSNIYEAINSGDAVAAGRAMKIYCSDMTELLRALVSRSKAGIEEARSRYSTLRDVMTLLSFDPGWLDAARARAGELQAVGTGEMVISATRMKKLLSQVRKDCTPGVVLSACELRPGCARKLAPGAAEELMTYVTSITKTRDDLSRQVDRVRSNSQEECCQVCLMDWDRGSPRYMTKCCQMLMCNICVLDPESTQFIATCPSPGCSKPTTDNLLMLDDELNLNNITEACGDMEDEKADAGTGTAGEAPPAESADIDEIEASFNYDKKIGALLRLIAGAEVQSEDDPWGKTLRGVMGSSGSRVASPEGSPRRILVFAIKSVTLGRVSKALNMAGIRHLRLSGTHDAATKKIREFKTSRRPLEVMLIVGSRDCAGIHLPEATMEIFMHRMVSPDIGAQLVGRGQRAGRRASMEVYTLCHSGMEE